jgi:hypothetical protein
VILRRLHVPLFLSGYLLQTFRYHEQPNKHYNCRYEWQRVAKHSCTAQYKCEQPQNKPSTAPKYSINRHITDQIFLPTPKAAIGLKSTEQPNSHCLLLKRPKMHPVLNKLLKWRCIQKHQQNIQKQRKERSFLDFLLRYGGFQCYNAWKFLAHKELD